MTNTFVNNLKNATNFTYTTNNAIARKSTGSDLYDLFALGGAFRAKTDAECINLFKNAFVENESYALKCLFYLRDVRGGQGERRFFRTCLRWLAKWNTQAARRNLKLVPEYGRWDDLYVFVGTPLEAEMFTFLKEQLVLDMQCKTPSLLAKWLKSTNSSSKETCELGRKTARAFGMSERQYRKTLSVLRAKINVLEKLMSEGRWLDIEFEKIPSKAGLKYRNAFARHDVERAQAKAMTYEEFAKSDAKVNADALYPYDVIREARQLCDMNGWGCGGKEIALDDTQRLMVNKYWESQKDYFQDATLNALCVVDTSGSMLSGMDGVAPIDVAISLGLYCAERAGGPFKNHYISFASKPQMIRTDGVDFVDKVKRIYATNLVDNTNIEAVFDLLLNIALQPDTKREDIPASVVIISDMGFDQARHGYRFNSNQSKETLMEGIRRKWAAYGINMPELIFWNVNAKSDNIPMKNETGITFVSGCSPVLFKQILTKKSAEDLMYDTLNNDRYKAVK